jgi:hypothetical protein
MARSLHYGFCSERLSRPLILYYKPSLRNLS